MLEILIPYMKLHINKIVIFMKYKLIAKYVRHVLWKLITL